MNDHSDFLIIGAGLAGLSFALKVADHHSVTVLTKTELTGGNTSLAQGGIASVQTLEDSLEQHYQDTLDAGAGLCHEEIVQEAISQGPERINDLLQWNVHFNKAKNDEFALTKEGGHSQNRILYVKDHTGLEIHKQVLKTAQAHPNINFQSGQFAIDLITKKDLKPRFMGPNCCMGAYILDVNSGQVRPFLSKMTILATGGMGKVYLYTTNWKGATGDGIAMAYRAGARVANLEFMQFHPTCLYHPQAQNFLISEAVRGEGGELVDHKGTAFMKNYHTLGSLAPRDIVARSIDNEMKRSGRPCAYIDITHKSRKFLENRFPRIFRNCLELGINMALSPIPIVPAAHYLCGGILTDKNGLTDLEGLFALGEVSCTGLHGANRLASNSLLECMVFSHNAAEWAQKHIDQFPLAKIPPRPWPKNEKQNSDELIVVSHVWDEIRRLMWNYMGIVRTNRRLHRVRNRLKNIHWEINEYYAHFKTHSDIEELRNIALVAALSVQCALNRKESRGIHYNLDFNFTLKKGHPQAIDTILKPYSDSYLND